MLKLKFTIRANNETYARGLMGVETFANPFCRPCKWLDKVTAIASL